MPEPSVNSGGTLPAICAQCAGDVEAARDDAKLRVDGRGWIFETQLDGLTDKQVDAWVTAATLMLPLFGLMRGATPAEGDDIHIGTTWSTGIADVLELTAAFADRECLSPGRLEMLVAAANTLFKMLESDFAKAPGAPL